MFPQPSAFQSKSYALKENVGSKHQFDEINIGKQLTLGNVATLFVSVLA